MSCGGMSLAASSLVLKIVDTMKPGCEVTHLRGLLDFVEFKGSEGRFESGTILEGARQPVPYPAVAWKWTCVQSYAWGQTQHINVLELLAFFNYLKYVTSRGGLHASRFFHVLDSRVCSCVIAKGRSSSKLLNRVLRRVSSIVIASDSDVLPMWTISAWNLSDAGSRCHKGPTQKHDAG